MSTAREELAKQLGFRGDYEGPALLKALGAFVDEKIAKHETDAEAAFVRLLDARDRLMLHRIEERLAPLLGAKMLAEPAPACGYVTHHLGACTFPAGHSGAHGTTPKRYVQDNPASLPIPPVETGAPAVGAPERMALSWRESGRVFESAYNADGKRRFDYVRADVAEREATELRAALETMRMRVEDETAAKVALGAQVRRLEADHAEALRLEIAKRAVLAQFLRKLDCAMLDAHLDPAARALLDELAVLRRERDDARRECFDACVRGDVALKRVEALEAALGRGAGGSPAPRCYEPPVDVQAAPEFGHQHCYPADGKGALLPCACGNVPFDSRDPARQHGPHCAITAFEQDGRPGRETPPCSCDLYERIADVQAEAPKVEAEKCLRLYYEKKKGLRRRCILEPSHGGAHLMKLGGDGDGLGTWYTGGTCDDGDAPPPPAAAVPDIPPVPPPIGYQDWGQDHNAIGGGRKAT